VNESSTPPQPPSGGPPPPGEKPAPPAAARPAPPPKVDLAAEVKSIPLQALRERFPQAVREVSYFAGEVNVLLRKEDLEAVCRFLKEDPALRMDHLSNLCGVDYPDRPERFEVVYHLFSISRRYRINLKIRVADGEPAPSVTGVWRTANWHEREAFDLLGIPFEGHPDLRRILMPDEWQGHPLRKEYPTKGYDRDHLKLR
jgi:NADH-quinone oxidoreductase subunit C